MAPSQEWALVRRHVGLLDRGQHGVLELTGRDRATFLDVHGKVQVVVAVWVADDRIFVVTPPAMATKTAEALDHYLFSEKVVIQDVSRETSLFLLAGPAARATAERIIGVSPPERPWSHVVAKLGDIPVRIVSGGGETG